MLRRVREYRQFKLGHKSYVGMLHRLDRDTSGSLAVALSKDAHAAGRENFKFHRFERHYLALVQGIPNPPAGTIEARISSGYRDGRRKLVDDEDEGLESATDYTVRERLNGAALLELRLHTGRQHQIRLHLEKIGHPLIGERVYSGAARLRQGFHLRKSYGGQVGEAGSHYRRPQHAARVDARVSASAHRRHRSPSRPTPRPTFQRCSRDCDRGAH